MKKILLFICAVGISLMGYAQQSEVTLRKDGLKKVPSNLNSNLRGQKTDIQEWYNYTQELSDQSIGGNFFTILFPDTLVKMESSTGSLGPVIWNSMGQTFDPKSAYWFSKTIKFDSNDAYTVDSISIPFAYKRYQFSNPDTLAIHVSKHAKLLDGSLTVSGNIFKTTEYDYLTYRAKNFTKEIILLLDDNDTTSFGVITEAINIDVNPGEVMGVSWTYLPGNPYSEGDTILSPNPVSNKINSFRSYINSDDAQTYENGVFNSGMLVSPSVRYNISTNGWNGIYISGIAYNSFVNVNVGFYVDPINTGIEDVNELGFAVDQNYPNPFSNVTNIEYALSSPSFVSIDIYDITGKRIVTINEGLKNTGEHLVSMDGSNLKNGVYYYTFRTDNGQVTKKMMIQR